MVIRASISFVERGAFQNWSLPLSLSHFYILSASEDEDEEDHITVAMAAHQAEMESRYQDLGEVDIESESFKALPVEVQHELITELQESSKKNSWARMHQLPKVG